MVKKKFSECELRHTPTPQTGLSSMSKREQADAQNNVDPLLRSDDGLRAGVDWHLRLVAGSGARSARISSLTGSGPHGEIVPDGPLHEGGHRARGAPWTRAVVFQKYEVSAAELRHWEMAYDQEGIAGLRARALPPQRRAGTG
jgi:hypothetical protein